MHLIFKGHVFLKPVTSTLFIWLRRHYSDDFWFCKGQDINKKEKKTTYYSNEAEEGLISPSKYYFSNISIWFISMPCLRIWYLLPIANVNESDQGHERRMRVHTASSNIRVSVHIGLLIKYKKKLSDTEWCKPRIQKFLRTYRFFENLFAPRIKIHRRVVKKPWAI